MNVYQIAQVDEEGHGHVSVVSAAIACDFFLVSRSSLVEHRACNLVGEMSKRTLEGKNL